MNEGEPMVVDGCGCLLAMLLALILLSLWRIENQLKKEN